MDTSWKKTKRLITRTWRRTDEEARKMAGSNSADMPKTVLAGEDLLLYIHAYTHVMAGNMEVHSRHA